MPGDRAMAVPAVDVDVADSLLGGHNDVVGFAADYVPEHATIGYWWTLDAPH